MQIEERIDSWVKRGFITEAQASKLRADVLLAQGQESEENLSRTGAGSILLVACALINGVVLVGSGHLTGVQGGIFGALGLWALSLAPMVYVLRHASLAGVLGCLVYVLVWMVVFGDASLADMSNRILHVPVLYLASGVLVFALGGTHYLVPSMATVARGLRLTGIYMVLVMLFVLGFRSVAGSAGGALAVGALDTFGRFSGILIGLVGLGAAFTLLNMWIRARTPRLTRPEGPISLGMLGLCLLYFFVPLPGLFYVVLFNVVLLAMIGTLLVVGVRWRDQKVLNLGSGALVLVLLSRYYDATWESLGLVAFAVGALLVAAIAVPGILIIRRHFLQPEKPLAPAELKSPSS
jgi:uncharacterized membrane protein